MLRLRRALTLAWLLLVIVALYLQHNVGLADNGYYSRVMTCFTSGPLGLESNWPDPQSQPEAWHSRFFDYWLPAWNLDFPGHASMWSTAVLLWAPGVYLNYFLLSPEVLYLTSVGLVPRLLLCLYLLLVARLVETSELDQLIKTVLLATAMGLLSLMIVSTDYVAYLNSFYFEGASLVYLFAFLLSLVAFRQRPILRLPLGLVLLFLLAGAKASNLYWPALGTPLLFYSCGIHKRLGLRASGLACILLAAALTGLAYRVVVQPPLNNKYNAYHSLFYGVLTLSDAPAQRLAELGIPNSTECIGGPVFKETGQQCFAEYGDKMSFTNTIRVILREPAIIMRVMERTANSLQVVSLGYLGKLSSSDPSYSQPAFSPPMNLWANIKARYFPRGKWLLLTLVVYAAVFVRGSTGNRGGRDFALVGLLTTIAAFVDMQVAFLGDGKQELLKHLFLANALFDTASIVFIGFMVAGVVKLGRWLSARLIKSPCFAARGWLRFIYGKPRT